MSRKIVLVIACVAVFTVGAFGSILILSQVSKKPVSQNTVSENDTQTAKSVISSIQTAPPKSLVALDKQLFVGDKPIMTAFIPNERYSITLRASESVVFTTNDPTVSTTAEDILKESEAIFTNNGLAANTFKTSTDGSAFYSSDTVSCQIQQPESATIVVIFACVNKSDITKEHEMLKKHISIYNSANPSKTIDTAMVQSIGRTSMSQGDVTGSIVTISYELKADQVVDGEVLLFGAISNDWEYVADLSEGESVGKVNMSADNLGKVTNEKWQGVLANLVGV